jgi:hypothetical protein
MTLLMNWIEFKYIEVSSNSIEENWDENLVYIRYWKYACDYVL